MKPARICLAVVAAFIAEAVLQLLTASAIAHMTGTPLHAPTVLRRTASFTLAWLLFAPLAVGLALRHPLGLHAERRRPRRLMRRRPAAAPDRRRGRGRISRRDAGAPHETPWRNPLIVAIGILLLAALRALVGGHVERKFLQYPVAPRVIRLHVTLVTGVHVQFLVVIVAATNLVRARGELLRRQAQILEADTQLARMEMNALRAHLQPGFLFLTLEGIARVVPHDAKARIACLRPAPPQPRLGRARRPIGRIARTTRSLRSAPRGGGRSAARATRAALRKYLRARRPAERNVVSRNAGHALPPSF